MREFLKDLELDKEVIDKIMVEHGKAITETKNKINELEEEISSYKNDMKQYEEKIKDFENKEVQHSKTLEDLQNITNENKDLKAEMIMNGSKVKKEFSKFVKSEVMANVKDDIDFEKALSSYKNDNPQYFGDTVVKKMQSSPTLTGGNQPQSTNDIMNNILRGTKD